MINIKNLVGGAIEPICSDVTDIYPQMTERFPCVQISEEDNRVYDKTQTLDYIRFRLDVWGTSSVADLACDIDSAMQELGFVRIAAADVAEPRGLRQKLMRYEAIVDTNTGFVFTQGLQ